MCMSVYELYTVCLRGFLELPTYSVHKGVLDLLIYNMHKGVLELPIQHGQARGVIMS